MMFDSQIHPDKPLSNERRVNSVSIVVNSCDDKRFGQFETRFIERLGLENVEVVRIRDASSMAEGYNRGAEYATGEWLFFCHDDIGLPIPGDGNVFLEAMREADVFGPCGTRRLVSGNWYDSGVPFNAGAVIAPDPNRSGAYRLELFGKSSKKFIRGVQALDGLFIASRRRVFDAIRGFDDFRLNGFHTYDVDYTFRAYLANFRCVVANELLFIHDSNVSEFGADKLAAWERGQSQFVNRFKHYLSKEPGVRVHENMPLESPEDALAVRRVTVESIGWWRRYFLYP